MKFRLRRNREENSKKFKIGLAFGGGGARGFAHIGALKAFEENGIVFDIDSIFEANKDIIEKNDLFTLFEKEFRRVLSQKEITTIAEWDRIYGYDKIVDALRIAVINRMMTDKEISFNYIGKILANGK